VAADRAISNLLVPRFQSEHCASKHQSERELGKFVPEVIKLTMRGGGYLPPPRPGLAQCQRPTCESRATEGHVGHCDCCTAVLGDHVERCEVCAHDHPGSWTSGREPARTQSGRRCWAPPNAGPVSLDWMIAVFLGCLDPPASAYFVIWPDGLDRSGFCAACLVPRSTGRTVPARSGTTAPIALRERNRQHHGQR
jgi:hypothetical protein